MKTATEGVFANVESLNVNQLNMNEAERMNIRHDIHQAKKALGRPGVEEQGEGDTSEDSSAHRGVEQINNGRRNEQPREEAVESMDVDPVANSSPSIQGGERQHQPEQDMNSPPSLPINTPASLPSFRRQNNLDISAGDAEVRRIIFPRSRENRQISWSDSEREDYRGQMGIDAPANTSREQIDVRFRPFENDSFTIGTALTERRQPVVPQPGTRTPIVRNLIDLNTPTGRPKPGRRLGNSGLGGNGLSSSTRGGHIGQPEENHFRTDGCCPPTNIYACKRVTTHPCSTSEAKIASENTRPKWENSSILRIERIKNNCK
ncbi:unnamed protein product [Sphagnum tenellum]